MSEQIEELEKQALAINKRIAELKAANTTTYADKVIEELKQPGTYMYIKGSCFDEFIIHPECKYRQATKKSVEFRGKSFYGGCHRTPPTVISWSLASNWHSKTHSYIQEPPRTRIYISLYID